MDPTDVTTDDSFVDRLALAINLRTNGSGSSPITVTCDCSRFSSLPPANQPYAYVDRGIPYEINTCPNYWASPETPNGSPELPGRVSILQHEFSHFDDICSNGSIDYVNSADGDPYNSVADTEFLVGSSRSMVVRNSYNWGFFYLNWYGQ